MPFIKSLASEQYAYVIAVILLLNKIMPTYFYYILKGLVYITIIAPLGRQPSFYAKYTKSNIRLSCNIKLVFNIKYMCFIYLYILRSLRLPYLIYFRVLCDSYYKKT